MEPESLLSQPRARKAAPSGEGEGDFGEALRAALEQFASHVADDTEAVSAACAVVEPLLAAYGEPVVVEQWRDAHGVAARRSLVKEGQEERGLLLVDGMSHVLGPVPRTAREEERWLLNAEARHHQILLTQRQGLILLAWRSAGLFSQGRLVQDHWRATVRPLSGREMLANYPVEAFLRGLQEVLTRRVERSRQWADFIRALNQEFEKLLS